MVRDWCGLRTSCCSYLVGIREATVDTTCITVQPSDYILEYMLVITYFMRFGKMDLIN